MIDSITLSYDNKIGDNIIVHLSNSFVCECIEKSPIFYKKNRKQFIKPNIYKKLSVRKKINLHIKQYVKDMKGKNLHYIVNSI